MPQQQQQPHRHHTMPSSCNAPLSPPCKPRTCRYRPEQYNRAPYVRTKGPYRALTNMPPVDTLFKPQPLRQQLQRPAQQKVMQISTHIHPRSTPYRVVRQPPCVVTSASCCGSSSSQASSCTEPCSVNLPKSPHRDPPRAQQNSPCPMQTLNPNARCQRSHSWS